MEMLVHVFAPPVSAEQRKPWNLFSGEEASTDQQHRVANVVLAAGDDMTLLATYGTRDPQELQQDMMISLHYRPLDSGESQVFSQRLPIQDLMTDNGSALMQRSALVERYANWALNQSDEDPALREMALRNFSPSDNGLIEMADQVQRMAN